MEAAICEKCGERYPIEIGCVPCRLAEEEKAPPVKIVKPKKGKKA